MTDNKFDLEEAERLLELVERLDKLHRESSDFGDGFDAYAYIEWPRLRDVLRELVAFVVEHGEDPYDAVGHRGVDLLARLDNPEGKADSGREG